MPVLRYFMVVGGVLLALLFVCSAVVAPVPLPATLKSGSDLPTVRIRSERKWPERVVIDTNVSTAPAKVATADTTKADTALQASAAADAQKTKPRDAFAQMGTAAPKPAPSTRLADNGAAKPATLKVADATVPRAAETKAASSRTEAKPKRRIARTHPPRSMMLASRSMMLVAQQPQPHFGFFGFDSTW